MSAVSFETLPDDYDDRLINTKARAEFQKKSFIYRYTHLFEKISIDDERYGQILRYFDEKFEIHDIKETARIWSFVLKAHNISWKKEDDLTVFQFKEIYKSFEKSFVYSGPGAAVISEDGREIDQIFSFLLAQQDLPLNLLNIENIKKIFISSDPVLNAALRLKIEETLRLSLEAFQQQPFDEVVFQGFVYNLVALLSYTYPNEGTEIQIPMKIGTEWKLLTYTVDKKFEITPAWFSSPLPIYGLLCPDGPPIISCLGTTYPAGEGFVATLLSDCTPAFSVGHFASLYGKNELKEWLKDKQDVRVTGTSLGGALSFHISRHHPDAISEVYVFNPAGLYPCNWQGLDLHHIQYKIYYNENDLVATEGMFPEGDHVAIYRVLAPESENFLSAHAKVYTAARRVSLIRTSADYENSRPARIALTLAHMLLGPILFFVVLPLHLIYRFFEILYDLLLQLTCKKEEDAHMIS